MALPHSIRDRLTLPAVAAPMFLCSGVEPTSWLKSSLVSIGLDPANLPTPQGRSTDHLPGGIKPWRDIWSAGQGIGLIRDIPTVAELVRTLQEEYVAACAIPDIAEEARVALEQEAGQQCSIA